MSRFRCIVALVTLLPLYSITGEQFRYEFIKKQSDYHTDTGSFATEVFVGTSEKNMVIVSRIVDNYQIPPKESYHGFIIGHTEEHNGPLGTPAVYFWAIEEEWKKLRAHEAHEARKKKNKALLRRKSA